MLNNKQISYLCYNIDKLCREELYQGTIVSERDYVSTLSTHLRHPFGPFCNFKLCAAQTLRGKKESALGCDAIIIFHLEAGIKIGLFEAKLPRYQTLPHANWDSIYKSKKSKNYSKSRFSTQLEKQNTWSQSGAIIWELIINEAEPGKSINNFDPNGASCVTHEHAYKMLKTTKKSSSVLWTNNDLAQLLKEKLNFQNLIWDILSCKRGKAFQNRSSVELITDADKIQIPIVSVANFNEMRSEIESFLIQNQLTTYFSFDLRQFN